MSDTIKIKPKSGVKIRHHSGRRHLDPKGETVPRMAYYLRRVADGDAEVISNSKK